jgi:hypothetical protein
MYRCFRKDIASDCFIEEGGFLDPRLRSGAESIDAIAPYIDLMTVERQNQLN